ncbi:MAG: TetR/AcrR family transcriptional regulator [Henriciella sp.]
MSQVKRKRGRPASIDKSAAMQAVIELFRSKGYAAVSLDELSDVTGLSRPSLYRTFGNKLSMYVGAMNAFGEQVREQAVPALQADGPLETAIASFLEAMLSIYYRDSDIDPGCLVFGTAPSSADEAAIKSRLRVGIEQLDDLLRSRILRSVPNCPTAQLNTATHLVANTLIAFSARAKSGESQANLTMMSQNCARAVSEMLGVSSAQTSL